MPVLGVPGQLLFNLTLPAGFGTDDQPIAAFVKKRADFNKS
jgi:hypothetical protein